MSANSPKFSLKSHFARDGLLYRACMHGRPFPQSSTALVLPNPRLAVPIFAAGHVWTTSLEQQLLRFSGPCHPNNGCLLQRVDLMQLLPAQAACLYPMDCQSVVQQAQAAGLRANSGSLVQGAAANDNSCGQRCAAMSCLLIVTAHAGPKLPGAVAVFKVEEEPAGQHAQGFSGQASTSIRLVSFWQDRLLQQPNMVAAF